MVVTTWSRPTGGWLASPQAAPGDLVGRVGLDIGGERPRDHPRSGRNHLVEKKDTTSFCR